MERPEKAKAYFHEGYNCCQSVLAAFSDVLACDKETLLKMGSAMGGGISRLREVCGAFSAIALAVGLFAGYTDPKAQTAKAAEYKSVQALAEKFKEQFGPLTCRGLLGGLDDKKLQPEPRTESYYKKRPCSEYVEYAAKLLDDYCRERSLLTGNHDSQPESI